MATSLATCNSAKSRHCFVLLGDTVTLRGCYVLRVLPTINGIYFCGLCIAFLLAEIFLTIYIVLVKWG